VSHANRCEQHTKKGNAPLTSDSASGSDRISFRVMVKEVDSALSPYKLNTPIQIITEHFDQSQQQPNSSGGVERE
jgi:hypothetical protein